MVECIICGNSFNNAYRKGRLISKTCSRPCRTKQFYKELSEYKRKKRMELRKQHRCIWCQKKVKPITTYPQFCKEHNEKNRKLKQILTKNEVKTKQTVIKNDNIVPKI